MKSYVTSYAAMFGHALPDVTEVERVEIPVFQRDYAQGRPGLVAQRVRETFLDALFGAVTTGDPISLDFVYGEVVDGTLYPLDGQQRLTTLFLLHWYLAWRAGSVDESKQYWRFTYSTRASARLFCERLVLCKPPAGMGSVSKWLSDQAWFLATWRHDPTIASMLVMLDAIHRRFTTSDCAHAWGRLMDETQPAITFHLLPIEKLGPSEHLYIKMNSRGKPLTPFENFKAQFEKIMAESCPEKIQHFASKVDGDWADILWPYRGRDSIVDDEYLRYFQFITELVVWREGRSPTGDILSLAGSVYGVENAHAAENVDFLCAAFEVWVGVDVPLAFAGLFTARGTAPSREESINLTLFGQDTDVEIDLFEACCRNYAERGRARAFGLQHVLLLYAVILNRRHGSSDFPCRLRIVRNLIEASSNELRVERMPTLVAEVERIVMQGELDSIAGFNKLQVGDELAKRRFLEEHPVLERALCVLEDQDVLRGCLAAFELDATTFERRAKHFQTLMASQELWPDLLGALLATGDYSRQLNPRMFLFGSKSNVAPWRELLTGTAGGGISKVQSTLAKLLDNLLEGQSDLLASLSAIQASWLQQADIEKLFDWRYYFVKYDLMRSGRSGLYAGLNGALGYAVCMLDKRFMNSRYRDPYLSAIHSTSGVADAVEPLWFTGYETLPRWMRLAKSGVALRCVDQGLEIRVPETIEFSALTKIWKKLGVAGVASPYLVQIPQVNSGGSQVDTEDRVQRGATLLVELVNAGF